MTGAEINWGKVEQDRVAARRTELAQRAADKLPAARRRRWCGRMQLPVSAVPLPVLSGLALSGGGIRSATFPLGLLRAMGRAQLIPRIDYLSTVSGGTYIGAMLCSPYVPLERRGETPYTPSPVAIGKNPPPPLPDPRRDPFADEAGRFALTHLRNNGRHLLPGGAGDTIRVAAIMTRNWLAIQIVIGVTLLTAFMLVALIQASLFDAPWLLDWEARLSISDSMFWPSYWLHGVPIASSALVLSWLCPLTLMPLAMTLVTGSGFWFTSLGKNAKNWPLPGLWSAPGVTASLVALIALMLGMPTALGDWLIGHGLRFSLAQIHSPGLALVLAISSFGGTGAYVLAHARESRRPGATAASPAKTGAAMLMTEQRVRSRLTDAITWWFKWTLIVATFGLFDTLAQSLYVHLDDLRWPSLGGLSLAGSIPLVRKAILSLTGTSADSTLGKVVAKLARFGHAIALIVGLLLATVIGLFWAALAHAIVCFGEPIGLIRLTAEAAAQLWLVWLLLFLITCAISMGHSFVNLSSLSTFYIGRLRRAYLGASNPQRRKDGGEKRVNPGDVAADNNTTDDILIAENAYYAGDVYAPLDLINVTINDTASGSLNLTRQDRHGKPLVISPAGILFPKQPGRNHTYTCRIFKDAGKEMPLSSWVGISGAALSTGLGAMAVSDCRYSPGSPTCAPASGGTRKRQIGRWLTVCRTC